MSVFLSNISLYFLFLHFEVIECNVYLWSSVGNILSPSGLF